MNKKLYLAAAVATLTLAACSDDSFIETPAVKNTTTENTDGAIMFGAGANKLTRAGEQLAGKDAAEKLGDKFVVYGYKGTFDLGAANKNDVFTNYAVTYQEGTAGTTASNVADWEYVGNTTEPLSGDAYEQIIKYWDYSAPYYNMMAWSIGKDANASIKAITRTDDTADNGDKLTFTIPSAKDAAQVYISNRYTATPNGATVKVESKYNIQKVDAAYQKTVTLTFRNLAAKVRLGIYETIPGYSVNDVVFYEQGSNAGYTGTAANQRIMTDKTGDYPRLRTSNVYKNNDYKQGVNTEAAEVVGVSKGGYGYCSSCLFAQSGQQPFVKSGDFDVTYGATDNVAKFTTTTTDKAASFTFGELWRGTVLGTTSNTATLWPGNDENNNYTYVLPMESNQNELYLKVDYTLTAQDGSGETIRVQGATAVVPAQYAQWKANYAYTYLFKISDKTNGHTGGDTPGTPDDPEENTPSDPTDDPSNPNPAGLYPITFDACVINTEDGMQETITTIAEPSITTYQNGSKVTENNEYLAETGTIYANVMVAETSGDPAATTSKLADLTPNTNIWLYTAEKLGNEEITEASVANGVSQIALTDITTASLSATAANSIPTVDGYKFENAANKFVQFAPVAGTTYVIKYKVADDQYAYKVIKVDGTAATYTYAIKGEGTEDAIKDTYINEATKVSITNNSKAVTSAATAIRILDEADNDVTAQFKVEETTTAGTYSITPLTCTTGTAGTKYYVKFGNATLKEFTVNAISITAEKTTINATESVVITVLNKASGSAIAGALLTITPGTDLTNEGIAITTKTNASGQATLKTTNLVKKGTYTVSYLGQKVEIKVLSYTLSFGRKYVNKGTSYTLNITGIDSPAPAKTDLVITNGTNTSSGDAVSSTASIKAEGATGDLLKAKLFNAYTSVIIKDFAVAEYTPETTDPIYGTIATGEHAKFIKLTDGTAAYTAADGDLSVSAGTLTPTSVKGVYKLSNTAGGEVTVTCKYKTEIMTTQSITLP